MNPIRILTYLYYWSRKANRGSTFSALLSVSGFFSINVLTLLILIDILFERLSSFELIPTLTSEYYFLGRRFSSWIIAILIILTVLLYYALNKSKINNWLVEFRGFDNTLHKKWKRKSNVYLLVSFIAFVLSILLVAI